MTPKDVPMLESLEKDREVGCGRLLVTREEKRVQLPLARVAVSARAADRVAQVTQIQAFRNPFAEPLEAVYLFPLAGGCAVSAFEMKVGERVIRGKVEERAAARRHYERAIEQGKRAALFEQERDDVFTVQVGNLPPGEEVEVRITYSQRLPFFEDGRTELRLPLVVAPRYIPGEPTGAVGDGVEMDTDQVPDASRVTPPRLAPGFDPQVALSIDVELADGEIADLACSQHATKVSLGSGIRISLARKDELLDRDFVLRWRVAGAELRTTLLTYGEFGMLSILPPKRDGFLGVARDVIFVVDRSGSMGGVKMASAARACSILLGTLGPRDRFAIQAFDDRVEWMDGGRFVPADEKGLETGEKFLRTIEARGGTELDGAIREALAAARKVSSGRIPVIVVITDGQVGNESEIFKRIQKELGDARVFTVGVDTAVNEGFLKRLASLGGGTSTFVVPGDALEDALRSVGREIGEPLVVDVRIEGIEDPAPGRMPDLFAGRASTAFFRTKKSKVKVIGRYADGRTFQETVEAREVDLPAIGHLWARVRVVDLEDRFRLEPGRQPEIQKEIVKLSVAHTLLTRFTAFVVVDESEVVNEQGERRRIVQPVHEPARWESLADEMAQIALGSIAPVPCAAPPRSMAGGGLTEGSVAPRGRINMAYREAKKTEEEKPAPQTTRKLREKLEAFARALAEAKSADELEKARTELLSELTASGIEAPALQRFLRSAAVELVAALRAGGADALLAKHRPAFEAARREIEGTPFWQKTI